MNLSRSIRIVRRAFSLLETLVYVAVLAVVSSVAFAAYYRTSDTTRQLTRNADDITRALRAGEGWRADVRAAVGPLRLDDRPKRTVLHIPSARGEIRYRFENSECWRETEEASAPLRCLDRVVGTRFEREARGGVSAWRWELELASTRRHATVKPLFTFLAAAGNKESSQ